MAGEQSLGIWCPSFCDGNRAVLAVLNTTAKAQTVLMYVFDVCIDRLEHVVSDAVSSPAEAGRIVSNA